MSYKVDRHSSLAVTATATVNLTNSIDVSNYDKFCIQIENSSTANGLVHIQLQGSLKPSDSAADTAPTWVNLNSTTYPLASALGQTSVIASIPYDNVYNYIRVQGRASATASAGIFTVRIGGFQRRYE